MRLILTALIFLFGLFDLFIGASFLLDPLGMAPTFGLAANGVQGLSSLRGDYLSFFGVTALCMMLGAWRRNGDLLLVPAALMGTVLAGRAVSLMLDGTYPGWPMPMVIEALHVVLLIAAWRVLPHHRIAELTG